MATKYDEMKTVPGSAGNRGQSQDMQQVVVCSLISKGQARRSFCLKITLECHLIKLKQKTNAKTIFAKIIYFIILYLLTHFEIY